MDQPEQMDYELDYSAESMYVDVDLNTYEQLQQIVQQINAVYPNLIFQIINHQNQWYLQIHSDSMFYHKAV